MHLHQVWDIFLLIQPLASCLGSLLWQNKSSSCFESLLWYPSIPLHLVLNIFLDRIHYQVLHILAWIFAFTAIHPCVSCLESLSWQPLSLSHLFLDLHLNRMSHPLVSNLFLDSHLSFCIFSWIFVLTDSTISPFTSCLESLPWQLLGCSQLFLDLYLHRTHLVLNLCHDRHPAICILSWIFALTAIEPFTYCLGSLPQQNTSCFESLPWQTSSHLHLVLNLCLDRISHRALHIFSWIFSLAELAIHPLTSCLESLPWQPLSPSHIVLDLYLNRTHLFLNLCHDKHPPNCILSWIFVLTKSAIRPFTSHLESLPSHAKLSSVGQQLCCPGSLCLWNRNISSLKGADKSCHTSWMPVFTFA